MNASENCIRHQDRKVHWICPKCESGYCPACVSKRSSGLYRKKAKYFCPKCNIPAEWVGASNLIPPFWKRLHNFFTYPIARGPLLLIFVCAGLCSLPSILGPLGFLFNLPGWGLSLKYAFEILRATSRGKLVPPKIDMEVLSANFGQVFQQTIILIILALLGFSLLRSTESGLLLFLYIVLIVFFWPAIVILQVTSGSILSAINPLFFVPLVVRIGWAYLLMYFFLLLVFAAPAYILSFVDSMEVHPFAFIFCKNILNIYYMFLMYHLMGYVLLQYHLELGYSVDYEDFEDINKNEYDRPEESSPEVIRIELLLQEGRLDEALSVLRGKANTGELADVELAGKYHELLKIKSDFKEMCAFAPYYMKNLLAAGKIRDCVRIYEDCAAQNAGFLSGAAVVPDLGEELEAAGKYREALKLYGGFLRTYPQDGKLGEICLRAAILLNERMASRDRARRLLEAAMARIPESPVRERIANYLKNSL